MPSPKPSPHGTPDSPAPSPAPRRLFTLLAGACGFFLLLDLVFRLTGFDKHPYLKWEQWPGFYGIAAFVACLLLVTVSRFLVRPLVKRDEDYYEKSSTDAGGKPDA